MALDLSGGAGGALPGSRILVGCDRLAEEPRVAGLAPWRRAIYTAYRVGFEKILIVAADAPGLRERLRADHRFAGRDWEVLSPNDDWAARVAAAAGRWVVLAEGWVVEDDFLATLAASRGVPAGASADGPFSADADELVRWAQAGWTPGAPPSGRVTAAIARPAAYVRVTDGRSAKEAEDALFGGLARNVTNFFARWVDRPMSRAISRRLAPTPVTPNQITIFSTLLGIIGSLVLLDPSYAAGLVGSFLFFAHTVIDGCDGEIARLKFQESKWGAKLDLIGDNVVHAFLFPCLCLRFYFADPSGPFLALGVAAFAGIVASWLAVYFLIVREEASPRLLGFFELFANREFAYLLLALGIAGRLEWFVWAMAIGIWIFPVGLFALRLLEGRKRKGDVSWFVWF